MAPVAKTAAGKHFVLCKTTKTTTKQFITGSGITMTMRNHEAKYTAEKNTEFL